MKIVITGSLGNISKPLAQELVTKGHTVTVVSSKPEKQKDIEAIGAKAAFGTVKDTAFLTDTFTGADAVYCMIPPGNLAFNSNFDLVENVRNLAQIYKQSIEQAGVKKVVFLSSIGAHATEGVGILSFYYHVEKILNELPADVSITFMRPVGFYYNLLAFINTIKTKGVIASNYGGDTKKPWVSPIDIATAAAEELTNSSAGRKIRYVASEEISCNEIASILGAAIGMPDLKWVVISNEQMLNSMTASGMNPEIAKGFVDMNVSSSTGVLYEDYYKNKPLMGKIKIKDYAKDFAAAFNQK